MREVIAWIHTVIWRVRENSDGYLKLNNSKVYILKDLYEHDVIYPQYYGGELNIIDE